VTRQTKVPSLPAPTASNQLDFAKAVKGIFDVREGLAGDPLDANVTFRALADSGLISVSRNTAGGISSVSPAPGSGGGSGVAPPDLTTPPAPSGLSVTGALTSIILQWNSWAYGNHAFTEIWRSSTSAFAGAVLIGTSATRFYPDAVGRTSQEYWYWIRFRSEADVTGPFNSVSGTPGGTGRIGNADLNPLIIEAGNLASGAVTATKLADGAVELTKFANGIEPVTIVTGTVPTTLSTRTIYRTDDGKMYRWNGSAYVATIPSSDLVGTIDPARIADGSIAGTKFATGIEPISIVTGAVPTTKSTSTIFRTDDGKLYRWDGSAYVTSIPATDLSTQITSTMIADNAITTPKILAGSVTTNTMSADSINGDRIQSNTLAAGKIVAGSITTTQLQAGGINADRLVAGSITTDRMSANSINGDRIQANTLDASKITANTITAGQIAAGAIGANQIAAGAIRAQHILVTPKSLNPDPSFEAGSSRWVGFVRRLPRSDAAVPANCPAEFASEFNQRDNPGVVGTAIEVVPGEVYRASCWLNRGTGSGGAGVGVYGLVVGANGNVIDTFSWPGTATNAAGWVRSTGTYVIPSGGAYLRFGPWADRPSYTGQAWYSELSIEKVNDASLIVDGAITANKIAANAIAVGTAAIQNGAITNAMIDNLSATKLTAGYAAAVDLEAGVFAGSEFYIGGVVTYEYGDPLAPTQRTGILSVASPAVALNDDGATFNVDYFRIFNGTEIEIPFEIVGGAVRARRANIEDLQVTSTKIDHIIQSTNWNGSHTPLTPSADPHHSSVGLLLNFDASSTADQSSLANAPITATGISFETASPLAGAASIISTSSSQLLYAPSTTFNHRSVYTIEFRIRRTTGQSDGYFMGRSAVQYMAIFGMSLSVTNFGNPISATLTSGVNHHIALCSDGTTLRLFRDGVLIESTTPSAANLAAQPFGVLGIPGRPDLAPPSMVLDGFRLTQGVARYTANFTPPSGPLPGGPTPGFFTNFGTLGWAISKSGDVAINSLYSRGAIAGGGFSPVDWSWPTSGGGFFVGPQGIRLGREASGQFFEVTPAGALRMPGLTISGGNATFSGSLSGATGTFAGTLSAAVVETGSIVGGAVTTGYSVSTSGATASVTVTVPAGSSSLVVVVYLGAPFLGFTGTGKEGYSYTDIPEGTLSIAGSAVTTQSGTLIWSVPSPASGTYSISCTRDASSGVMNMGVLLTKR
jgi:hypothetical protein